MNRTTLTKSERKHRVVVNNLTPNSILLEPIRAGGGNAHEQGHSLQHGTTERFNFHLGDLSQAVSDEPSPRVVRREEWRDLAYTAPEVVLKGEYGCATDVWSLGCVVFEILNLGERLVPGAYFWSGLQSIKEREQDVRNKLVELQVRLAH